MALPVWTQDQILHQLDSGYAWSTSVITFAFPSTVVAMESSDNSEPPGFKPLDAATQASIRIALQAWDDLIAPNFQEITSGASDIEAGFTSTGVGFAQTYFPDWGTMWLSSAYTSGINNLKGAGVGSYGFATYLHELGHGLGLDHMGNYDGGGHSQASSYQDSTVYSVMSYFGPNFPGSPSGIATADWTNSNGSFDPQTPMLSDVMAIQAIYGASATTRTGDTTYGFHSNVAGAMAAILDFTNNPNPILTLFDSGGNDTLDLSGWNTPSTISLVPGTFSSCDGMTSNIAIAYSATIENAVGGGGADSITGNAANNLLQGGGGSDTLAGGAGNDSLQGGGGIDYGLYGGTRAAYSVGWQANGASWQVAASGSDTDALQGVERLVFADKGVALDIDGNAGMVAKILGAVFGPAFAHNDSFVGIGLHYADSGMGYADLMQLALQVKLGAGASHEAVVFDLYTNVVGSAPDPATLASFTQLIDNGTYTPVTLGMMAADTGLNAIHIGLTGMAQAGLDYLPWG